MFKKIFALLWLCTNFIAITKQSPYPTITQLLTKKINLSNIESKEFELINILRAFEQHGDQEMTVSPETLDAIKSVKIEEILPKLIQPITHSGKVTLLRFCLGFTDNAKLIEQKTAFYTKTIDQNTYKSAQKLFQSTVQAEAVFANLFKQLSEEEIEDHTKIYQQLYFSKYGLDRLNESATALEVGPRLNQTLTTAWYTIPIIAASFFKKEMHTFKQALEQMESQKEKYANQIFIKSKPIKNIEAEYNQFLTENLVTLKTAAPFLAEDPNAGFMSLATNKKFLWAFAKSSGSAGIKNLPNYTKNWITDIYEECTKQAIYHLHKDALKKKFSYNPDQFKTKVFAAALTGVSYLPTLIALYLYTSKLNERYHSTKNLMILIHDKQQELIKLGTLIQAMQKISTMFDIPESQKLAELFDTKSSNTSQDLKNLIQALRSWSFQGSDAYFFAQYGKILATHHLLVRIKGQLIPYFEAYGAIDAYCAIAAKMHTTMQNNNLQLAPLCFVQCIQDKTPALYATNYWHPYLNPATVVTNSLTMDLKHGSNLIITGPNAGGKTTSLMAIMINLILAQSLGIAAASEFIITPFAKLHSYLDITTSLQEGLSLFAAEVDRAKKLKNSINSCTPNQKTFTIIDELFTGTDPKVATEICYNFAKQLGTFSHSMTLFTTHFPEITKLEQDTQNFVNFKVADATIHENGTISYPFKLVPGISSQNIATHMLEQSGII